jgi:endogenous inhibitor of DNA gyrase (YacG/DUF329 family)
VTHGDSMKGVKCPHCRKINVKVLHNKIVTQSSILEYEKPCEHCGKPVYFWVMYTITIDAEKANKVK